MQNAMAGTVDEVERVTKVEGIDADLIRVDKIIAATNAAQLERVREGYQFDLDWQMPPDRVQLLSADEAAKHINIADLRGAIIYRGMARVQPAKLVRGLARVVEGLGVSIYEGTSVTSFEKGRVDTDRGVVRAPYIIRATEGFSAGLPGYERTWLALNSAQIVTEPVPDALWKDIGWEGHELLGDAAHAYCYAQRTREGRITMGGRGVPYRFGSKTDINGQTQQATINALYGILTRLLPQTKSLKIDHAWCGVLGVPRDWCTTAGFDRSTGIGWAGGYVGLGVSSSNLAGPHACRSCSQPRDGTDRPALGEPHGPQVGAGAVPLARRTLHVPTLPHGGRPRIRRPDAHIEACGACRQHHRPLKHGL